MLLNITFNTEKIVKITQEMKEHVEAINLLAMQLRALEASETCKEKSSPKSEKSY